MFLKKNVQKRYEAINIDIPFLLLFTALWATCTQKRLKRHEAKVGQSVANSSKNGKWLMNSLFDFSSFFLKTLFFTAKMALGKLTNMLFKHD